MKTSDSIPKELKEHIDQLERIRQDFVANVSHELRTPLTVMHGYLESLLSQSGDDVDVPKKTISQLYQHTLRMENVVSDLLLLSSLEGNQQLILEENHIDIPSLLKALKEEAETIGSDKKHKITIKADEHLYLTGSEKEIKSLFSNLIVNAVKYTPDAGEIVITWFEKNDQAVFQVKDTGIGIDEKHIPRITERFYRVDKARSRDSGGTGLGLAIVKHVLMRHEAKLDVQSKLGSGSVFSCTFPETQSIVIKTS